MSAEITVIQSEPKIQTVGGILVMQVDADAPHCQFLDSDGDIKDCALSNLHDCRNKAMKAGFHDCVDDLAFKEIGG